MKTDFLQKIVYKLNIHAKYKRRLIVLMRMDAIGDFVLWLDAAKEYKRKYPGAKIVLLCRKDNAEWVTVLPYFDSVIGIDLKKMSQNIGYFMRVWTRVQLLRGCYLIQSVYSRNRMMNVLAAMVPAYRKITVSGDKANQREEDENYNDVYDQIKEVVSDIEHELIKNARYLRRLGFQGYRAKLPKIPEKMMLASTKIQEDYYVMVLGTSAESKSWPIERFSEVAKHIYTAYGITCCLLGLKEEMPLGEEMVSRCEELPIINLIGKTSILEYMSIIARAVFVVAGDTSAVHIAAATRTKSVVVGGGWHFERFLPYKTEIDSEKIYFPRLCYVPMDCYYCNHKKYPPGCKMDQLHKGKWTCILAVTSEMVIEKVDEVMEEYANSI